MWILFSIVILKIFPKNLLVITVHNQKFQSMESSIEFLNSLSMI